MAHLVELQNVRFEHHRAGSALGIGSCSPRISWHYTALSPDCRDWVQTAYEIEITLGGRKRVYYVKSSDSVLVPWPAEPLLSRELALVRIRGYDRNSTPTAWSTTATVEAGLLQPSDWSCEFITSNEPADPDTPRPPLLFRHEFVLSSASAASFARARVYATAHGLYELSINTTRVGDLLLAPGWTEYDVRHEYQTYDVSSLLQPGSNTIVIEAAEGWFSGRIGYTGGERNIWGTELAVLAMLIVDYTDGDSKVLVKTGSEWSWSKSATTSAEIYDGEHFDAQYDPVHHGLWKPVSTLALDHPGVLAAPLGPPIRATEEMAVREIITSPTGKTILDFGQNLVGYVRVSVPGDSLLEGKSITISHAEVLDQGEIATRPLRFAKATDKLTLSGEPLEWNPKFTFHGFRYAQVDGLDDWSSITFTAIVIHSDMARTGWFKCSNPLINQLHSNIVWSMRGNFVGLPTDCPQRDERLGYTGDLQVFARTGNFLYDTCGVLSTWLQGVAADQARDGKGVPPMFSPNVHRKKPNFRAAVWGDCAVIAPWELYQSFADADLLRTQYQSMTDWVDKGIKRDERGLWDPKCTFQLGDWLDPYAPPKEPAKTATDPQLVADAYLVHVTDLMALISQDLGNLDAAERYRQQASSLRKAFQEEYVTPNGRMASDSQTAFALAIHFDLLPSARAHEVAGNRLAYRIRYHDRFKIGTGFAGTPIIGHALTRCGKSQLFYRMLMHKKNPSWLYPVMMGATTIWERWDSMLPDKSINEGEMTSFNHYALGAVGDWLHRTVGGLYALEPGWKRFAVSPVPGGGLDFAEIQHESPYGRIEFDWKIAADGRHLKATLLVPPNTVAEVHLPGQLVHKVGSGRYEYAVVMEPCDWPPLPIYPPYMPHDDDEP
ncbi:bacterial alpha-L-rhamnosidase-domain-containing protein [Aspergillus pseudodeflectus]|uniref:alpha-L-rhamnosidase n=1 Tax=Aspergillus pseudodeflectus TaxID=176178 RepID=A0ABR4JF55_9EURO